MSEDRLGREDQEPEMALDTDPKLFEENRELYRDAVKLVRSMQRPTVVSIQRAFRIGYGRAMNIIDVMILRGDWPHSGKGG